VISLPGAQQYRFALTSLIMKQAHPILGTLTNKEIASQQMIDIFFDAFQFLTD